MDIIKKMLFEKNYNVISKITEEEIYHYCLVGDKIFFLKLLKESDELNVLNNYAICLSQHIEKESFRSFFDIKMLTDKDQEKRVYDLRAFLWDLYIIGIRICGKDSFYKPEDKSRIERSKLIARKLVIQAESYSEIITQIKNEFCTAEAFDSLYDMYEQSINEEFIISQLLDKNLVYEDKTEQVNEILLTHISDIVKPNLNSKIDMDNIELYLRLIRKRCAEFKIPV